MPFKKRPDGTYMSPSGKVWTKAQVQAYYASKSDRPAEKKSPPRGPHKRSY